MKWAVLKSKKPARFIICWLFALVLNEILWSRPDSNRCPNKFAISLLHVYLCIDCREKAGTQQTNLLLRRMFLSNRHIIRLQHPVFVLSRRRHLETGHPVRRP